MGTFVGGCGVRAVSRDSFRTGKCGASAAGGRCITFSGKICVRVISGNVIASGPRGSSVGGGGVMTMHFMRRSVGTGSAAYFGIILPNFRGCPGCCACPSIFHCISGNASMTNMFARKSVCTGCNAASIPPK